MTLPRRIPVLVVLPPRALLLDVAGPVEVLRVAHSVQDRVVFDVAFAAPTDTTHSSIGLRLTGAGPLPDAVADDAVVLVAGAADRPLGPVPDAAADADAEDAIVAWLRDKIRPGHRLISICDGALLAGRAGLLDGHACTTHHASCARLAAIAPNARVLENRLFVIDRDRLSSAGVTAGVDLMLHLLAEWAGATAALAVARTLVVYTRRGADDPQLSPWLEGRNHLHPAIHRAQDAIAADPARDWSLEALAMVAHASARNLSRLFNAHTGMTVSDAVNRTRIAAAKELLGATALDMEAVAEQSGFGSARHMRTSSGASFTRRRPPNPAVVRPSWRRCPRSAC